jgi:hypothetical protein
VKRRAIGGHCGPEKAGGPGKRNGSPGPGRRNGLAGLVGLGVFGAFVACGGGPEPQTPAKGKPQRPVERQEALASFEVVRSVLQHPRCQNCHPAGDAPLQGDEGHVHLQNVQRGPEGRGMVGLECTTCHGPANPPATYGAHIPPGVSTGWRMPKPDEKLVFVGVAPAALCEQVKNPAHNGGKDQAALLHHLEDPLVAWGWTPGVGRTAIPVSQRDFMSAWKTWARGGSPCPTGDGRAAANQPADAARLP